MKLTERTKRITGSIIIALLMVGGSYVLSGPSLPWSNTVDAESAEELLKEYAAKDTDTDGLPDWQEALYGTDPTNAYSNGNPDLTDGEAARQGLLQPNGLASQLPQEPQTTAFNVDEIPGVDPAKGSITERFSATFMQRFVAASGGVPMDEATREQVTQKLLSELTTEVAATFASRYQIVSLRPTASASINAYAASVEEIIELHDIPGSDGNPYYLMRQLIHEDDATAAQKLTRVSQAYKALAADLASTPVPPYLMDEHLALVRSFDELASATSVISRYKTEPLGTLAALRAYQDSSDRMSTAINSIATVIVREGVPGAGQPGSLLVGLARIQEQLP